MLDKFLHGRPSQRLLQDLADHGLNMSAGTLAGGIGGRFVGVVAAALALKVARVVVTAVFGGETLVPGPSLNQRAVHAEVRAAEPIVFVGDGQDFVEEFDDCVMLNQAFPVLGKDRGNPDRVIHGRAYEPAKQ